MAVLDWLFEGSPPPSVSAATTSQTNMPDWYQDSLRSSIMRSSTAAAEPYQPYTGARVAPATAQQQQAYDMTGANVGSWQPNVASAQNMFNTVGSGFNQNAFQSYMNPYTQNVTDAIARLGQRNLTENLLPQVNDTFIGSGQFGGSRNAEFTNRAVRDANESILNQQAKALMDSQNAAMSAYQTGTAQQLQAGQQLGQLGQITQQAGLRDAAALQSVGQEQQALAQKNADVAYQNFAEQRAYPRDMATFMNQQIRGLQPPTQTTSSSTGPGSNFQPSPLSQLVGGGLTAAAIYPAVSKLTGAKRGGLASNGTVRSPRSSGLSSLKR